MALTVNGVTAPYSVSDVTQTANTTATQTLAQQAVEQTRQRNEDLELARQRRLEQERLEEERLEEEEAQEALELERRENAERLYEASQAPENPLEDPFSTESLARQSLHQQQADSNLETTNGLVTPRIAAEAVTTYEETEVGPEPLSRGLVI